MSSSKTHNFDWRKLEEKPDNWETLRHLIGLCNSIDDIYIENIVLDSSWNLNYMDFFRENILKKYGAEVASCFPPPAAVEAEEGKKKKPKKKAENTVREKIHRETEKKIIEKDLDLIRFDTKTFRPTCTTFRCQPTFSFMIAEWAIMIWKKRVLLKHPMKSSVVLDAMISMDRICNEEISNPKIHADIRAFFQHMRDRTSTFLGNDEKFRELFEHHPELMVNPLSQKREGRISPYPEQIKVLNHTVNAVMRNLPMLLGDRMPPGTGKSFLAVPLAQKLAAIKSGKTVLFACNNQLVRTDIATNALLGKNMHLWMGRYNAATDEYLVRPYKTCFPVTWKKVYKTQDENKTGSVYQQTLFYKTATTRFPDIMVTDLETCRALLQEEKLQDQFVAYIDEFVCGDAKSNQIMADIAALLPRQTVLLSAILPRFQDMPSVVRYFQQRHGGTAENVIRIESNQLTISCTVVDPDGCVALPHHFIETADQIPSLITRIREDPLIGRMYAPQQVYGMVRSIEEDLRTSGLLFHERFPNLSRIDHSSIRDYVLDLLAYLRQHPNVFDKMKKQRPPITSHPQIERIATHDSHHFQGRTLVITPSDRLFPILEEIRTELHKDAPDLDLMTITMEKKKAELQKKMDQMSNCKFTKSHGNDPIDHQNDIMQLQEEIAGLEQVRFPRNMVVNSVEHAQRYQHDKIARFNLPPILPKEVEGAFSNFLYAFMLSGIGVYDFSQCTEYQRRLVMRSIRHLTILFAGHEIVFGTNIEGLTHLFIDGAYGDNVSRNVLFQLIGRAGRVGQSYEAKIALNSWTTLHKIMSFIDPVDEDALFFESIFAPLLE
jgi:hypothetical protein